MYYLKSRYYDPATKRFLNADGYVQTGDGLHDKNMFAYCLNNSVISSDSNGHAPWMIAVGFIVLCGVVGGVFGYKSKDKLINRSNSAKSNSNNSNQSSKVKNNNFNGNVSKNQQTRAKSQTVEEPNLSSKDKAMNTFIGATLGIAAGGAIVALTGVAITLAGVTIIGAQIAAIGCLAFNAEAIIFAPFYGVELEPIDWDYGY